MSEFIGLNTFGNLTANGKTLTFKDFDKNNDGTITEEEYNTVLQEMKLDTVEISSVDTNNDKNISQEEFAIWEQKIEMQNAVNDMAKTITKDFCGSKSQYIPEVTNSLKEYINTFADSYTGEVSNMSADFKVALPNKYNEVKTTILANDPSTIKSNVLENIYSDLISNESPTSEAVAKRAITLLSAEADNFIKTYSGNNLSIDLKAHLEEFLNSSDATKLKDASEELTNGLNSLGVLIDENELESLKTMAESFLTQAIDAGVTVKLGNTTIKTTTSISSALNKFKDGDSLKTALLEIIDNLSSQTLLEKISAEEEVKAQEATEKQFTGIKGESYQVNASLIDYSSIDGYFDNGQIYERGKGWSGSRDKAYDKGLELLNNESLKTQMKSQIENMLKEKGVPFDRIATVFENIYNQSVTDTLNSEDMITGRGARGLSSKGKAYINIKNCVDTFITIFNTNIAKAIDEMNASDKDMDLYDIDFTQAGKDENGNPIIDEASGEDLSALYASGKTITVKKHGADYFVKIAEQMVDNMKAQMLKKAMNMCTANGVEFDNSVFTTMFNNAKSIAVQSAVSGVTSSGKSFGGVLGSSTLGASVGAASMVAVGTTGLEAGSALVLGTSIATGPIGWIAGGVAVAATTLGLIGFGHHSQSSFNAKTLLDTFTEQFKTNYTQWVDAEKNK